MLATAARTITSGTGTLSAGMLTLLLCSTATLAFADNLPPLPHSPNRIHAPDASARCAMYGEGFVPVAGGDGCVKIGGRLRIDIGGGAPAPAFSAQHDGFSPAAHLRVGR